MNTHRNSLNADFLCNNSSRVVDRHKTFRGLHDIDRRAVPAVRAHMTRLVARRFGTRWSRFGFIFGFETPHQRNMNCRHGWDDEDSATIIIRAENADDARAWGREVAHESVRRLFEQANAEELPNWKDEQFAEAIEEAGPDDVGVEVAVGEMPPIDWLSIP